MNENERKILLALARNHIDLKNEVAALRMLYQSRSGFSEEEYQAWLVAARKSRAHLVASAGKSDDQALDDLLRDFEGPLQ